MSGHGLLALFLVSCAPLDAESSSLALDAAPTPVWFAIGQSNMLGASYAASLPPEYALPFEDIPYQAYFGNSAPTWTSAWIPLSDSTPFGAGGRYGPEVTFARDVVDGGRPIALLKYAVNGAPLHTRWVPHVEDLYPAFRDFALSRLSELPGVPVGLLWVGCEGDATNTTRANAIPANLSELVAAIEDDFGVTGIRAVLPRLHAEMDRAQLTLARAKMIEFAESESRFAWIDTDDLALKDEGEPGPGGDQHYDAASVQIIGQRGADVVLDAP